MKAHRTFNIDSTLASARAGELTSIQLSRAIIIAREFGQDEVADELQLLTPSRRKGTSNKKN